MTDEQTPPPERKNRPTPSRKEAEAARRQERRPALTRKQRAEQDRRRRQEIRAKQREALSSGRGEYLPPRDQGPVKAYVRDHVDRRHNIAEFLLPILVFMLLFNIFAPQYLDARATATTVSLLWSFTIVATVLDEVVIVRSLKKGLRERFPEAAPFKGTTSYAVLRSSQIRRLRLPKPAIKRGEPFKSRY